MVKSDFVRSLAAGVLIACFLIMLDPILLSVIGWTLTDIASEIKGLKK